MLTVAVAARGVRCRNRCQVRVMLTVTTYLPSLSCGAIPPRSTPQPRWIPQAFLIWNGSEAHCSGNGDLVGLFGPERWGWKLFGQNGPTFEATILPDRFLTVIRKKRCSPTQLRDTAQFGS